LVLFTFVFSVILRVPLTGERTPHFAIFLFCGLLPWLAVHESLVRSATAITDNANLVKKLTFPSELLVGSVVLTALINQLIALAVFVVVLAVTGQLWWPGLAWLPLAMILQVTLSLGLGLLLSSIQVLVRDVVHLLGMGLTIWFYCTPIVYPLGLVPERLRPALSLNPMTVLVGLYRRALLGGDALDWRGVGGLAIGSAVLLFLGARVFRRLKKSFADEI
jgi:ABC-type polysaccharide/polyol phosphate export permease